MNTGKGYAHFPLRGDHMANPGKAMDGALGYIILLSAEIARLKAVIAAKTSGK